jgi:hypothetical protein
MQIEFFNDKSGTFTPGIQYRELGEREYKSFDQISDNKKNILYNLFADNADCRKLIKYQQSHGVRNRDEILKYIIAKKFARLDPNWDIDDIKLNFEN